MTTRAARERQAREKVLERASEWGAAWSSRPATKAWGDRQEACWQSLQRALAAYRRAILAGAGQ